MRFSFLALSKFRSRSCSSNYQLVRRSSSSSNSKDKFPYRLYIGSNSDVYRDIFPAKVPSLVPVNYYPVSPSQSHLSHLSWLLKKDLLGQDAFLIGPPGGNRRRVALSYAQITNREVEYISLSRDTTESDLKQRREIRAKTAEYVDQTAVRAAIHGRLLVIEGIEKAERNVLPLLNNLLENREMNLEDGRHLISAVNYDKLLETHTQEELDTWKLVRVHPDFRVIALGLPVPFFKGNPLDPPLRSRFQCRFILPEKANEVLTYLQEIIAPNAPANKLELLTNFAYSVLWSNDPDFKNTEDGAWEIDLPVFPMDNLVAGAQLLNKEPNTPLLPLLHRLYPWTLFQQVTGTQITEILQKFGFSDESKLSKITRTFKSKFTGSTASRSYVPINGHEKLLGEMLESFQIKKDICLVGGKGGGKSVLVRKFSEELGIKIEPIVLYKDMSSRDLVQSRRTTETGDTIWVNSPLVEAALSGKMVLLDGIHELHSSTLSILHQLLLDRELQLPDGTRLLRKDRFDSVLQSQLDEDHKILPIHPDFYVVATGVPPPKSSSASASSSTSAGSSGAGATKHQQHQGKKEWLTPEILSLFLIHKLEDLTLDEEIEIIQNQTTSLPPEMENIVKIARSLRESTDSSKQSLASSLSTRQLIRIARRYDKFYSKSNDIAQAFSPFDEIERACLARFLPTLNKEELRGTMSSNGIIPLAPVRSKDQNQRTIDSSDGVLRIGSTSTPIWEPEPQFKSKIPQLTFYNIQQHVVLLEELLMDYLLGEHLLLVGNQGVGKNKLVDQLLHLLNRPREYIQLHRDSTVQSLTLQQKVKDGIVTYEDSPLVRAARYGHVIIIDEADKAPTHVTSILKTLAESGEMILSDNRRIVPNIHGQENLAGEGIIPLHPNFRMFVLANRPGFPFLGNDFYSVLGDLFSVHAIDNPSIESEIQLLSSYAPNLPKDIIERIARAFHDLRSLADEGTISYPYSTREAVNIVKHLQKYPNDSLTIAIDNVFDFDVYNYEVRKTIKSTLKKYKLATSDGFMLRDFTDSSDPVMVSTIPLDQLQRKGSQELLKSNKEFNESDFGGPKHGKVDASGAPHVGGNTWAGGSGGRDTAGLGGVGGPYRLSDGNPVFQVSDEVKMAVPPEVRRMARAMAQKAFEEKLKEIQMSKYEGNIYEEYLGPIRPQIQALRVILNSLQAKAKERKWVKNQTSGELDDSRIIEGVVGERNIYKQRRDEEPEVGDPWQKPKRLILVVDLSGSMYRFNGYDRRLDRVLECALLVMEGFQGYENMFKYDIFGHSGDDCKLPVLLSTSGSSPKDNKDRLDILRIMHLHSQFCSSGDNTLEATEEAIQLGAKESDQYDETFVITLSDANLERYGIPPRELGKILESQHGSGSGGEVHGFVVFIGSLGDQAQRLKAQLPPGKAYICLDTAKLPQIIQRIFTQTILA